MQNSVIHIYPPLLNSFFSKNNDIINDIFILVSSGSILNLPNRNNNYFYTNDNFNNIMNTPYLQCKYCKRIAYLNLYVVNYFKDFFDQNSIIHNLYDVVNSKKKIS